MARSKKRSESRFSTDNLRKFQRIACGAVVEAYLEIKSALGTIQARDYEPITGGTGAQYDPNRKMGLPFVDFVADVEYTISQALPDTEDRRYFLDNIAPGISDMAVLTELDLRLQEAVGRLFIGRELFPVKLYFTRIKRGKE